MVSRPGKSRFWLLLVLARDLKVLVSVLVVSARVLIVVVRMSRSTKLEIVTSLYEVGSLHC